MAEALVLTGPTGSGKTALALDVAERVGGEIVSVDSRQVYRGMDIGTAKASAEERRRVPHHGIDLVDPDERHSAGRFAAAARGWIAGIRARGRAPILEGGTGFFLRALTHPMFREPEMEPVRREALEARLERLDRDRLRAWLTALDPVTAQRLSERGGTQRTLRALEIALLTGRPLSWWHEHAPAEAPPLDAIIFVLAPDRDTLDRRIDRRVTQMIDAGLVDEVRSLLQAGYGPEDPGMSATGYAELVPVVRDTADLEEAADAIRRKTRRYARRQLTWFRRKLPDGARWLDATRPHEQLVDTMVNAWNA